MLSAVAGSLVTTPFKDEYSGCNGGGDRASAGGKSSRALCEGHGFAGRRQIGSLACHRSVDANHSINLRRSGFAASGKGRAGAR